MEKEFFVYILASGRNGTLYIGVTSDLRKRVGEHKEGVFDGFTKAYGVNRLVWFEQCADAASAIASEKRIKAWKRAWKIEMIERTNPYWRDLHEDITA
jgi:putative endonuclease